MKHKAILYTCAGLMAAAAVMGFADYHYASKSGLFDDLYAEEEQRVVPVVLTEKELEMKDYSRAAFEYREEPKVMTETKDEGNKPGEELPPPPPAPAPPEEPPVLSDETEPALAPAPELPVTPPAVEPGPAPPAPEVKKVATVQPSEPPVTEEVKEVNSKSFSRAPLRKKKIAVAKKI